MTPALEHVLVEPGSPWWAEHRSRYRFAAQYLDEGIVLDAACGSALGADLIAATGRYVVGLDISAEAIGHARSQRRPGYALCRGDVTQLPFSAGSVDAVLSFETVEHVHEDRAYVSEIRRVLRADGVLILSTPNALVTKPVDGVPANPFHVREYTPEALAEVLAPAFSSVEMVGQRVSDSYGVCPYWEPPRGQTTSGAREMKALTWKALARVPSPLRESVSRRLWGRSFYPGERDFDFTARDLERAHVLIAVCRP